MVKKMMQRRLLKDEIRSSKPNPRPGEGVWRFVSNGSRGIWSTFVFGGSNWIRSSFVYVCVSAGWIPSPCSLSPSLPLLSFSLSL